jgi:putative nucleotidyltransferase with HDIG domain
MSRSELPWWGRGYVGLVAFLGLAVLAHSIYSLYATPIGWNWFVLALLTLLTGSATVKLPSVPATISISETFVFTSALLYGPAAGALTVALDALVISLSLARKGHPAYRLVFNIFALPAALWVGATLFFWNAGLPPLSKLANGDAPIDIGQLLRPLILFTGCYFGLNSWLIAFAIAIEKRLSPVHVWKNNFAWLSLNYFGGASVAALLVTYTREVDYRFLAIVLPLLAILYFTFSTTMGRVEDTNRHLSELNSLYMSTIETLAMAIDAKDQITHGHIRRVQHYAVALAKAVGIRDPAQIRAIEAASLLHDMGKLAVPEHILNKPGTLTPAEFEKMKLHASVGADILSAIDFPYPVVPIVRHHHESWDGSGYPDGLSGTDIPIGARILSVVDCFDALTSDRPYRPRLPDADAVAILRERRGRMYDPLIVDTFIGIHAAIGPAVSAHGRQTAGFSAITRYSSDANSSLPKEPLEEINASSGETLALWKLATDLSGHPSVSDATNAAAGHLRRLVPASTCVFYAYDEVADELIGTHASGEHAAHFSSLRIPRGQRLSGWVAANKQSVRNSDPVLDLGGIARELRPPLRSCLGTPIQFGGETVGVLTLYSTQHDAFREDHQRIIEAVARQIAPTLRAATRIGKEQRDTGSRLDFNTPDETRVQSEDPISVIVIGIRANGNKDVSFTETTLSVIREAVRDTLQPEDTLFRYTDSTFVVVLPRLEKQSALALAERMLHCIGRLGLPFRSSFSVQVGTASTPDDGISVEQLIHSARQAFVTLSNDRPPSVH